MPLMRRAVDLLWPLLVAVSVIVLVVAVGTARADVMTDTMRQDHDAYRVVVAEETAQARAEWVLELIAWNGPYVDPPVARVRQTYGEGVEQWRGLVTIYFPAEWVEWALTIMHCESRGNPNAKSPISTASGLFQHLASYWQDRSGRAGWAGADIFNPEANIAVAAWLLDIGGPSHWECKAPLP